MEVKIFRFSAGNESTNGLLFIDDWFICYTLEDEKRYKKLKGETRIPEGTYELMLRNYGSHYERYTKRFPWHKGMIQVKNVPGFTDILFHIGNTDADTAGCILVGNQQTENLDKRGNVTDSTDAYIKLYKIIGTELLNGEKVMLKIYDENWIKEIR